MSRDIRLAREILGMRQCDVTSGHADGRSDHDLGRDTSVVHHARRARHVGDHAAGDALAERSRRLGRTRLAGVPPSAGDAHLPETCLSLPRVSRASARARACGAVETPWRSAHYGRFHGDCKEVAPKRAQPMCAHIGKFGKWRLLRQHRALDATAGRMLGRSAPGGLGSARLSAHHPHGTSFRPQTRRWRRLAAIWPLGARIRKLIGTQGMCTGAVASDLRLPQLLNGQT